MRALTAGRATAALRADVEHFERLGFHATETPAAYERTLVAPGGEPRLVLRLVRDGRVFGGTWALEVSTADPVLPATARGLTARGRGVVRMHGIRFRPRARNDPAAAALAEALSANAALGDALGRVHFERIEVDADGRPRIRHLGGSVVWVLFPPVVRTTPLPDDQAAALVRAVHEFARAGAVEARYAV